MADKPVRREPRYPLRISAELRIQGQAVTGITRNLSAGGVCVEIDRPIKEGVPVQLTLFVVEDDVEAAFGTSLEVNGTVQWTAEADRGYATGIKFGTLSPQHQAAIERAIKQAGG